MPTRIRLALSFALMTLVLVVAGAYVFEHSFRDGLESSLAPGLQQQATTFARSIRSGDVPNQRGEDGSPSVISAPDVVAQVLDRDGLVVTTTSESGLRRVVPLSQVRAARRHGVFRDVSVGREREPHRALVRAVDTSAGRRYVVVATSLEPTNAAADRLHDGLLIGGAAAVLVAGIGGWLLAGAALRPVERMRRKAAAITEHDAGASLPVPHTRDEIEALATTINALLADLHASLARQRAFVADAGHELRTPLAVLRTELELAARPQRTPDELRDAIAHASEETDRLARLTDNLLFLARRDEHEPLHTERVAVRTIADRAVAAIERRAVDRQVRTHVDAPDDLEVPVDPDMIRQALDNLLENALRHTPAGGAITVRAARDGDQVVIDVVDDGPGFPPEFLAHAFERFRRADDARTRTEGGAGLGLAIVRSIADAHGGDVCAANRPEGGAIVTMRLSL